MTTFSMDFWFGGEPLGLKLPVVVMDDDFIEFLEEHSYLMEHDGQDYQSMDITDFGLALYEWIKEECE